MSRDNVELFRRNVDAYNTRDIEGFVACFDPHVEVHSQFAGIAGGVYHGHEGVRRWHRDLHEAWGDQIWMEPEVYFDLGEYTLVSGVLHGRGRHSGVEVHTPDVLVARWRDGLIVYLKAYGSKGEALRDLGVSEDSLDPIPA
jgi:ketosteroid isomerase-like protein